MRSKKILLALTCTCMMSAAMVGSGLLFAQETVTFPEDVSNFKHVGSMVTLDEESPMFGMHHAYLHPNGMEAFQQRGPYPAGTVAIVKLYEIIKTDEGQLDEGNLLVLAFMRKDETAKATAGWLYALFDPDRTRIEIDVK